MDRIKNITKKSTCKEIATATADHVDECYESIKQMNRKLEMTLEIVLDHFKELDERIEELEDKLEEK